MKLVATLMTLLVLGCASDEDPPPERPGHTACGGVTCQAGQYCQSPGLCVDGCLSNDNCAGDQACSIDEFLGHGVCVNEDDPPPPPADPLERCQAACTKMVECGLATVEEGAGCHTDCAGLTAAEQTALGECVEPWDCAPPLPGCLAALQCGPSFPCADPESTCVDHQCL